MKQLAKSITRHHSLLVVLHVMLFSLLSACESQSLVPAQATQFEDSLEGLIKAIRADNLPEVKRLTKAGISPTWPFGAPVQQTAVHLVSEFANRLDISSVFYYRTKN
jgi:hypothetical protein